MKTTDAGGPVDEPGPKGRGRGDEDKVKGGFEGTPPEEPQGGPEQFPPSKSLVRLQKTIVVDSAAQGRIDSNVVHPRFYNSFNYTLLPRDRPRGKLTIGVTSPDRGDGKSLVAANLAVSLAIATELETLLLDLNLLRPKVHEVFGIPLAPGILESLNEPTVCVRQSRISNLSILSAGDLKANVLSGVQLGAQKDAATPRDPVVKLEHLVEFRNVLFSLEEKYQMILVDLPSIRESIIPTLFMKQLDGVLVVINTGKTKKEDIDELFGQVNEDHVLGFVLNRISNR